MLALMASAFISIYSKNLMVMICTCKCTLSLCVLNNNVIFIMQVGMLMRIIQFVSEMVYFEKVMYICVSFLRSLVLFCLLSSFVIAAACCTTD